MFLVRRRPSLSAAIRCGCHSLWHSVVVLLALRRGEVMLRRQREVMFFPADWLTPGAKRTHEHRWPAVGKRDMSSPISARMVQAAVAPTPGISSRRATTVANG